MTRFARAKGSKSSNEKAPEDSTPWEVMKEQLLQAKKEKEDSHNRQQAEQQRIQNYENFLKEQKVQKRKAATWCDFPEAQIRSPITENTIKNNRKHKVFISEKSEPEQTVSNGENVEAPAKKKRKKNKNNNSQTNEELKTDINKTEMTSNLSSTPTKKKKKKNKNKSSDHKSTEQQKESKVNVNGIEEQEIILKKKKDKNTSVPQMLPSSNETAIGGENQNNNKNVNMKPLKKKKNKKLINGKPQRRKDVDDKSFQIIINGAEVELERVDGFPVMKRDAERLNDLKKNMIQKGIPKSEIQRTMKLERRRAEKALARVRKQVCYNCRKGGHNLSDCPDLKAKIPDTEGGEGICFKCGSTEHRQFECKVQRDKEFRFATCFICKEPGHIARQCPDNPKGLYPNGGGCKLCGDVTHLRKDCPTVMDKKEDKSIKLTTLDSTDDVEGIGQQHSKVGSDEPAKKVKKIKF